MRCSLILSTTMSLLSIFSSICCCWFRSWLWLVLIIFFFFFGSLSQEVQNFLFTILFAFHLLNIVYNIFLVFRLLHFMFYIIHIYFFRYISLLEHERSVSRFFHQTMQKILSLSFSTMLNSFFLCILFNKNYTNFQMRFSVGYFVLRHVYYSSFYCYYFIFYN